jgi:hypothetical protein
MSGSSASRSPLLESLASHVALPPRLPGKADSNVDQIQSALTNYLLDASSILRDQTNGELSRQWESFRNILYICRSLNAGNKLNKSLLLAQFGRLKREDLLILHVAEQNAGLLIGRKYE